MRTVIQRVSHAQVTVEGQVVGQIQRGMVVLVGFTDSDEVEQINWMARKVAGLRIFEDSGGKMNLGLADVEGQVLVVPNFTLYGDVARGRRPSFSQAAEPRRAEELFQQFIAAVRERGVTVGQGQFGASMQIELVNDGPVTLIIDTEPHS